MPLFETYIFIDWSARSSLAPKNPSKDAIWVGELTSSCNDLNEKYFRSRQDCFHFIVKRLLHHFKLNHRILLGFDFAYGYPQGLASALNLPADNKAAWWHIWTMLATRIEDAEDNMNNRFTVASELNRIAGSGNDGPFWGVPVGKATDHLYPNSPGFPFKTQNGANLDRLRVTEGRLRRVQETWKLLGAGSVGGQTLVGIPYLRRLRKHADFVDRSAVWPFETNFTATPTPKKGPYVVHAEIWPGVVRDAVASIIEKRKAAVRDQIQVRAMCQWATDLDDKDEFGQLFNTPSGLDSGQNQTCIEHEGWILGA